MKLTLEEKQFILNKRKQDDLNKPKKIGYLKHDLFILKESVNRYSGALLTKLEKDEIIKNFISGFELVSKAGAEYDGFVNEYGDERWYDREYGINGLNDTWAEDNLINIKNIK